MSEPAPALILPIALLTCPASLTLLVLAGLTRQLPATSLDDAWDALPNPESYRPAPEVENWLREHWDRLVRPDTPDTLSQNVAPQARARENIGADTPDAMSQTAHPHARTREGTGPDTSDETQQTPQPHARVGEKDGENPVGRPPGASTHGRHWKPRFLEALAVPRGTVHAASRAAGIHRSVAYDARRQDPTFAAAWEKIVHPPYEPLPQRPKPR